MYRIIVLLCALPSILASPSERRDNEVVNIGLFYESLCPDCQDFHSTCFAPLVKLLAPYLNISTNPYGYAETFIDNGTITFECQHGPSECYANMMHACAIHNMNAVNYTAVLTCVIKQGHSEDSLTKCGKSEGVDTSKTLACIRDEPQAAKLLAQFGKEFPDVPYVPYPTINNKGIDSNIHDFNQYKQAVCAQFKRKPKECA